MDHAFGFTINEQRHKRGEKRIGRRGINKDITTTGLE